MKNYPKKYKGVISFWEYQASWQRIQYLKDWGIYREKGIHPWCARCDWGELTEFEQETIYKAHKKAVNSNT